MQKMKTKSVTQFGTHKARNTEVDTPRSTKWHFFWKQAFTADYVKTKELKNKIPKYSKVFQNIQKYFKQIIQSVIMMAMTAVGPLLKSPSLS